MKMYFVAYLATLIVFVAIDLLWLRAAATRQR